MRKILINIISNIFLILILILSLTEFSHSLDYFTLDNTKYEIDEVNFSKIMGCRIGSYTTVVIRDVASQEEIWAQTTLEQAKKEWFRKGKCPPSISESEFEQLFHRGKFVDFIILSQMCGASCPPAAAIIYRFDGKKVTKITDFLAFSLKVDKHKDQIITVNQINEGQCRACDKRWKRDIYEWDGINYKKIKSEESKEESRTSPWLNDD